jgi:hypothetical protein
LSTYTTTTDHTATVPYIDDMSTASPFPAMADYAELSCRPPSRPQQAALPLSQVAGDLYLCSYTSHCFSLCRCCTFLACDCRMKCPDSCSCFHDQVLTTHCKLSKYSSGE